MEKINIDTSLKKKAFVIYKWLAYVYLIYGFDYVYF